MMYAIIVMQDKEFTIIHEWDPSQPEDGTLRIFDPEDKGISS